MASFKTRKRKDGTPIITVQVRMRGYPARTASFPTDRLAKRWAKVTEASMIEGRHFKNVASRRRTFGQAADRYLADEIPKKRSGGGMHKAALKYWREAIGHLKLADITADLIVDQRAALASKPFRRANPDAKRTSLKKGEAAKTFKRSGPTVNRYLAVLSHVFAIARREWRWIDDNPVSHVTRLAEHEPRIRTLSPDERARLLAETAKNPKLHLFAVLALSTACRAGELLKLKWADADVDRGQLLFRTTKNAQPRTAWVSGEALRLLSEAEKTEGRVFENDSGAKGPWDYADPFNAAVTAAGIESFRFHDLRHSAATELARLGATEQQLKAIGGWKSSVVSRYVHLAAKDSRDLTALLDQKIFPAKKP